MGEVGLSGQGRGISVMGALIRDGAAWRGFIRILVGGMLTWSGAAKLSALPSFALTVRAYEVLPVWLIHTFAIWLPGLEVVAGILLLAGLWVRSSALAAFGMFVAFAIALGINVYRGADMSCGCFGIDGAAATLEEALVRDVLLLVGAAVLVLRPFTRLSLDARIGRYNARQAE